MDQSVQEASGAAVEAQAPERIVSVDVLRGFDMFWLVGGAGLFLAIFKLIGGPADELVKTQLGHVVWKGFRFYDLIFPLFVFVTGMSIVFSLGKLRTESPAAAYKRLLRRAILLYLFGLIYYGGMSPHLLGDVSPTIHDIRWLGVLQRIALCYLFAGILYLHLNLRGLIAVCVGILVGYWALLAFVPLPGHDSVSWETPKDTWPVYLDTLLLPGRKAEGIWDPEGILSTLPAICTCLLGVFAALLLRAPNRSNALKFFAFVALGLALAGLGWAWNPYCPVIKKIWTSSYVCVAGGYSFLLLAFFFLIVDVWKLRFWIKPFLWIGMNPITIYMGRNLLDFNALADRFVGGSLADAVGADVHYLLQMILSLAFSLLLLRFLYHRKIFLRV